MSQLNATSYQVPRTTGVCAATGQTLEPGQACYAALVEVVEEADSAHSPDPAGSSPPGSGSSPAGLGFKRVDISESAWKKGFRPEGLFSYWKFTVPEPNEKKKLFVDDAVLMNLLRRLEDADQPERIAFRYVLALILMRKKLLRYDGSVAKSGEGGSEGGQEGEQAGGTWWRLTPKLDLSKGPMGKWDENETIEVLDPHLDESQIEQVTGQLGEILEAEL